MVGSIKTGLLKTLAAATALSIGGGTVAVGKTIVGPDSSKARDEPRTEQLITWFSDGDIWLHAALTGKDKTTVKIESIDFTGDGRYLAFEVTKRDDGKYEASYVRSVSDNEPPGAGGPTHWEDLSADRLFELPTKTSISIAELWKTGVDAAVEQSMASSGSYRRILARAMETSNQVRAEQAQAQSQPQPLPPARSQPQPPSPPAKRAPYDPGAFFRDLFKDAPK